MANRKPSQSWDNLRYFLAVARTGTLSAAAEQLGTEHTTVARHIHALEEELNSRLFHRSNSGYGLTEVGERLLAGAEATESAYASAKAAASSEGQTISGTVRISTPDGFGLFLAPRVRVLTDRHPKLEIEILATARQFSLLKREADIAIGLSRPEHMRAVSRRLTDYRMYVYGSLAYLEKAAPIVTMQDLKNHPFIGYVEELLFAPEDCTLSLSLKRFDAGGDRNPALRTLHPDEVAWSEPTCVIKSAGFEGKHVLCGLQNMIDADSALGTEHTHNLVAAVGDTRYLLRQAGHCQAVFLHRHGHAEGAAGLALAFFAVAGSQAYWLRHQ
jgi:DNA-binding transcriptional LysR family regulator